MIKEKELEQCGIKKKIGIDVSVIKIVDNDQSSLMEKGYANEVAGLTRWALGDQ